MQDVADTLLTLVDEAYPPDWDVHEEPGWWLGTHRWPGIGPAPTALAWRAGTARAGEKGDMARTDSRFAAYLPHPAERHAPVTPVVAEATGDDVPTLALLQARARGGSAGEWADRIHRTLCSERGLVITAKVSGEAVGYANAAFLSEHAEDGAPAGYYLTGVTVDPGWRRRGIARLLTRRRMDWIRERDSAVWCFISAQNRASLDLHRELGFVQVSVGASFQGIEFTGGEGWLLRADPPQP